MIRFVAITEGLAWSFINTDEEHSPVYLNYFHEKSSSFSDVISSPGLQARTYEAWACINGGSVSAILFNYCSIQYYAFQQHTGQDEQHRLLPFNLIS